MKNILEIKNVSFSYESGSSIIENINLCIKEKEIVAICGKNGSGKTTLLKIFTGLLRPCTGAVFINEKNTAQMPVSEIASHIGFIMQNPDRQLFCDTVYNEAAFALKAAKIPAAEIKQRVPEALDICGLSGVQDSFPLSLSRGERAKVVIAAVLAMGPEIIIFDEPAGGQDYRSIRMIMDMMLNLNKNGRTIIFVTHNMSMAAEYAGRIIVMDNKRIVTDGTPEEVFCKTENTFINPPQITILSRELRKYLPLEKDALTVSELGEMLVRG